MRVLGTALLLASLLCTAALASDPIIRSLAPTGARRGGITEIRLRGQQLADPQELLFYEPGIRALSVTASEKKDGNVVIANLSIGPDCPLGPHALRLRTAMGVSNLVTFSVGTLTEREEKEPNNTFETAEAVDLDTTMSGVIEAEDADWFVVEAKQGERITAEVEAMRLASEVDPRLALYDSNRRRLALMDDSALTWHDAACSTVAPADGRYYIELREATFAGSAQARYRLHIGRFPRPKALFPPGGKVGQSLEVNWIGDAAGPRKQTFVLPSEVQPEFSVYPQDDRGTAPWPYRFRLSTVDNAFEAEPNNTTAEGTKFEAPAALNGILDQPGDVDCFTFAAKKGQVFDVRVFARAVRSPVDSVLSIIRKNGSQVASNDDADGPDSYIRFNCPADDDYTITIRDQLGRGGPEWVYRIEITPVKPQLTLALPERRQYVDMTAAVPRGNRAAMMVAARRADFGGKVELDVRGLPAGVSYETLPLDEGMTETPLLLTAAVNAAPAGALVDLVGRHKTDALDVEGHLRQRTMLTRGQNNRDVWGHDTHRMATAVIGAVPFTIDAVAPKVPLVQNGAMGLKVVAARQEGFNGPIALNLLYNPPGLSASAGVTIAEGQTEASIPLTAGGGAKIGTAKIVVLGQANVGEGPVVVASKLTNLEVAEPFLSLSFPQIAFDQGQGETWKIAVEKRKDFDGTAKAELVGMPLDVATTPVELTKDTTELVFSLASTAKSPPGRHKTAVCRITIVQTGEPIVHQFGPAELRIRPAPKPGAVK